MGKKTGEVIETPDTTEVQESNKLGPEGTPRPRRTPSKLHPPHNCLLRVQSKETAELTVPVGALMEYPGGTLVEGAQFTMSRIRVTPVSDYTRYSGRHMHVHTYTHMHMSKH